MRAGRGAYRAPPSVCGAVGGQGGGSIGRGARAHSSPAPRLPTPSPPPASPPPAHSPKEPSPAARGDIGHIGAQRRQGAGFRFRLRRAGRGQGFRCARTTPALCFPLPAWCLGAGGAIRGSRAPPRPHAFTNVVAFEIVVCATIYKCHFSCNRCLCNHLQMCRYPCSLEWIYTPRRGNTHEEKAGGTPDNGG